MRVYASVVVVVVVVASVQINQVASRKGANLPALPVRKERHQRVPHHIVGVDCLLKTRKNARTQFG